MSADGISAKYEAKKPMGLPDRIKKEYENIKHPSAIKLIPVAKNQEAFSDYKLSSGLTMVELNKFVKDPFWVKVRQILMFMSGLIFLAIFIVSLFIVVQTPSCEAKKVSEASIGRTRECKSDEECAAILNTSCMSDPRDYKMRCLCRDSSAPINGACPNRPRVVGSPCKKDDECIEGSECKSMNITVTSFKTCQCKEGFMSRDGYCSSAFYIPVPSVITLLASTLFILIINKSSLKI